MNPLIAITEQAVGNDLQPTVNARELHAFLEVGRDFPTWMAERIARWGFVENQDFGVFPGMGENLQGGRPSKEYALSLDMAKELAMVERNWRGKQARKYFIECERRLKAQHAQAIDLRDPLRLTEVALQLTGLVRELVAERSQQNAALAQQAPKVEFYDSFVAADGLYNLQNAGRALQLPPNKFIAWLRTWALFRQGGALVPYGKYVQQGMFEVRTVRINADKVSVQTLITPKGLARIQTRWENQQEAA